jgi:hypothetical protein
MQTATDPRRVIGDKSDLLSKSQTEAANPSFTFPRLAALSPWGVLFVFFVVNIPLFVCMGLDSDVTMWDLSTRTVLRGGVFYRDTVDNNFPGMLVPLLAARATLGWNSEVLRAVDLGIMGAIAWLLAGCLPAKTTHRGTAALIFVLFAFYFSTTEWCHCQRDTWMLLPALTALRLRFSQTGRLRAQDPSWLAIMGWGAVEGLLWAAGCWIKPFVVIPCAACWMGSAWLTSGVERRWTRLAIDGFAMLATGLLVGAGGVACLIASGAWPAFLEIMLVWNRQYAGYDVSEGLGWLYVAGFVVRFFPWVLVHLAAVPVAITHIRNGRIGIRESTGLVSPLLAVFYLAWLFQAFVLQHLFDYIHVSAILLALTIIMRHVLTAERFIPRASLIAFITVALMMHFPATYGQRLSVWRRSIEEGSTPELRDRLALNADMNWTKLEEVREFLVQNEVRDGELTCFSMRTTPLYFQMGFRPSTRHVFLHNCLVIVASERSAIHADLAASRQRFVVCDLFGIRSDSGELGNANPETRPLPAAWQPPSRWADRVVFRAGRYVVFAVAAAEMTDWLNDSFHV